MIAEDFYTNGEYLKKNPNWHADASPWKAGGVLQMMQKHHLTPKTICEVGCGAGEILKILQQQMDPDCEFWGYEIAPQAYEIARTKESEKLHFKLADFRTEDHNTYDLILIIDVIEHFEDMFQALRDIKVKSEYKIFQLPLDIHVGSVLRNELIEFRHTTGHLHFFTKDIALEVLRSCGYEILDFFYTIPPLEGLPWKKINGSKIRFLWELLRVIKKSLQRFPRVIFYALNKDLAVRVLGGWRMVVLTK